MQEYKKRRSYRGELTHLGLRIVGASVLLVITIIAVRASWGMYNKMLVASQGQEKAEAELANLKQEQVQVAAAITELSSPRGIEAQVRERFGVVRPGEGAIQIARTQPTTTTTIRTPQSWWRRAIHALFIW